MKTANIQFRSMFDKLQSAQEKRSLKIAISVGCKVPMYTVNNWKCGLCRIPELYQDKIEEIVGHKVFNDSSISTK